MSLLKQLQQFMEWFCN